ncbi:glycosyltransferase [Alkalihalobacillus sp. 1P02AB]|uniref:glycosyltransferase n=1 Tax=Alkalihalobacillus sp. 1P02AB TaxID=3132260 RepID=UPI0039A4E2C2
MSQSSIEPLKRPLFTVLVVTRNEENYIERLLERLVNQDFPNDNYEILIVDGMSSDNTLQIAKRYKKESSPRVDVFINEKKTLPPGWNIGIKEAKGRYILRIDGHTEVDEGFLIKYEEMIKKEPNATCVGGIIESKGKGFQGEVNEYVYSHPFGVGKSKFRTLKKDWQGYVDTVPYGAYKREIFEEVGYFNEDLKRNEDIEFHKRIQKAGGRFFLSTNIRSTYFVRDSMKGLIEKSFNDGLWSMVANRVTPGSLSKLKLLPLFAFLLGVLLIVLSFFNMMYLYILGGLFILYILLTFVVSIQLSIEKGFKYLGLSMLTFFCLHFFRGLGSFLAFFHRKFWTIRDY